MLSSTRPVYIAPFDLYLFGKGQDRERIAMTNFYILTQVQIDGKSLYRVRVRPEVDFKTAERMADQIKAKFKLKPRVLRYPE